MCLDSADSAAMEIEAAAPADGAEGYGPEDLVKEFERYERLKHVSWCQFVVLIVLGGAFLCLGPLRSCLQAQRHGPGQPQRRLS